MKFSKINLFFCVNIFLILLLARQTVSASEDNERLIETTGWQLVWHDEFDSDTLDLSKWRVEDCSVNKNNELQYYCPEEVYVQEGTLIIRTRKREKYSRQYTSGLVDSAGIFSQKYGRFEIRAKLPKGKGIWPAHWMLADSGNWPPEIDIMEMLGHSSLTIYMSFHWGFWQDKKQYSRTYTSEQDFSADFHIFAIEWQPDEIRWYVDGVKKFSVNKNIPHEPFYLILNTAVGGDWPGAPNSKTVFPQYHIIDYVRIYSKEIKGQCYLNICAVNGQVEIIPKKNIYTQGSEVILEAKPFIGYKFSHWSLDLSGRKNPDSIVMNKHKFIKAHFIKREPSFKLLSSGKPAFASSELREKMKAVNVVDGDLNTAWVSKVSDPQRLYIDLEKICRIEAIQLIWENSYAEKYEIQVSSDGNIWETIYVNANGQGNIERITQLNVLARFVCLYGVERQPTKYGYCLKEFEIFGQNL